MLPHSEYSTLDLKGNAASLKETYGQLKSAHERLVIGLDFGTTFTGVALLPLEPPRFRRLRPLTEVPKRKAYKARCHSYRSKHANYWGLQPCPSKPSQGCRLRSLHVKIQKQLLHLNEIIREQLIEALDRLLLLWLSLLQRLLSFCKSSEFPSGLRPRCTTMPWTIWPALVVLWGVCWMFVYGEGVGQDIYAWEGSWGGVGDFETDQGLFIEPLPEPFVFETDQSYQEGLDFTVEAEKWSFPSTVFDNARPSSLASVLSVAAFATDITFPNGDPILSTESGMPAIELAPSDFSKGRFSEPFVIPTAPAESSNSSANNPRHPCRVPNCHQRFQSKAALHEHENRYHTKPYKCNLKIGNRICARAFGRTYELKRHQDTVHKMAVKVFFCGAAGCKHARGQIPSLPFLRRDKLFQHQKQVGHGGSDRSSAERSSQDADTISNASGPSGSDVQVQSQNEMEPRIQVQTPRFEYDDNGREVIRESPPINMGEATHSLVTRVKALREKHTTEMTKLKEQQEREMKILREELETYEREIATVRGFLGG